MNRKHTGLSSIQSESAAGLRMRFVLRPAFRTTIAVLALAWRTSKTWLGERDSLQRACNGGKISLIKNEQWRLDGQTSTFRGGLEDARRGMRFVLRRPSERRLRSWRWHGARPKHGWAKEIRFSAPATGKRHCYRSRMNNGGSMAKSAHSTSKRIYAPDCRAHICTGTIARIIGQQTPLCAEALLPNFSRSRAVRPIACARSAACAPPRQSCA